MRILHITAGLWVDTGGPSEVIPNLCLSQVKLGHDVELITLNGKHSQSVLDVKNKGVKVHIFDFWMKNPVRFSFGLLLFLFSNINRYDVIHNHGHWLFPNWLSILFKFFNRAKLITTPHGTLVPGMLSHSKIKKSIVWILFDRLIIKYSDVIHALSFSEKDAMHLKIKDNIKKVKVIPNGVNINQYNNIDLKSNLKFNENKKQLLFLSRVCEVKGILDLLDAWSSAYTTEWDLIIVGPVDDKIKKVFFNKISTQNVTYVGPVYGDERFKYFSSCDAFILPSYAEGLPTVLLEAASGLNTIIYTPECNFDDLSKVKGGILSCTGALELSKALNELFFLSEKERKLLENNAFELIKKHYTWDVVSSDMIDAYKGLL